MSTTPRPPLLSNEDLYDKRNKCFRYSVYGLRNIYEAARAKDAELIQRLVDGLQQIADEGHWTLDMHKLLNAAAAAGFKPN